MVIASYDYIKERTIAMSGFFETSAGYPTCFGVTSGNHDGAGLSHGVLQYNLGTGSLQPFWNYLNTNFNQLCRDTFGAYYQEWADLLVMSNANAVAWGDSISLGTTPEEKRQIDPTWKAMFQVLGESQPSIEKQMTYAEGWRPNAEKWFKALGLWSRRGFALMWDISVQQGRFFPLNECYHRFQQIDPTGKTREEIEEEKLNIIVDRTAWSNRPGGASQIVYDRKMMLINGTGNYYGAIFDMSQYDLNYEPCFEWNVEKGLFLGGN